MYEIDFTHPGKIHFIGIGGISMSGFAELLHSMGLPLPVPTGMKAKSQNIWNLSAYK